MFMSLFIIFFVGISVGYLFEKVHIPKIIWYLILGVLMSSSVLGLIDDTLYSVSSYIRQIALVIILTRSGLSLDLKKLKTIGRSAILGIFIGDKEYRSNGYGTEAIKLLLEYGFKYLNLHSIKLELLAANERAHKCYLKCGFKDTGRSRDAIFLNGKYYDKLQMDILESEFEGEYIRNKEIN